MESKKSRTEPKGVTLPHAKNNKETSHNEKHKFKPSKMPLKSVDLRKMDPDDVESVEKAIGFSSFASTHGKAVAGNKALGAVRRTKIRTYRKFMHVPGIYKIPLTKQDQEYRAKKRLEKAALRAAQSQSS